MSRSEIFGGILRGGRGPVAALATQGLPAMPDWQPDPEDKRQAAGWPLRLLTAPGYSQSHTAYSGVSFLRRREVRLAASCTPRKPGHAISGTAGACASSTTAARSAWS
jgi:hypothetical protein